MGEEFRGFDMILNLKRCALGVVASIGLAMPVQADETYGNASAAVHQYVFDLGVGVMARPSYAGADSFTANPFPILSIQNFYFPGLGQIVDGSSAKTGFYFYPSFGFVGERKASDNADLTGTNKIDWALELGLGAGIRGDYFRAFAEVRQGVNGHTSQVGRFGLDAIAHPTDRLKVSFGPRADFAAGDYMDTYFGVTAAEAAASGGRLTAYNPGGGFKSLGLEAEGVYDLTDDVKLHLRGGYDRLVGDAAKSPIVKLGSKNQFRIGLGMSYRFAFDVFE